MADGDVGERTLTWTGRVGLAGRTVFYAILTFITARVAALGGASQQDNAHGALSVVSGTLPGEAAIAAVVLGFALFGVGRLVGAWRDRRVGTWRRVQTLLEGAFYLVLAYVPATFLAGNTQTGSEQQQHTTTAKLLGLPAGRELVIAVGVAMVVVCGFQIRTALKQQFADGLDIDRAPGWVRLLVRWAGTIGIAARAVVFVPVGVFLVVAAIQLQPSDAKGIDGELLSLSGAVWGSVVLAAVALGLGVFAVYSGLEARYRKVVSAR